MAENGRRREGGAGDGRSGTAGSGVVPRWLPWAVYGVVTLFLFREFVVSDRMLLGTDTLSLGYMARDFFDRALERGVFPLWNPIILGGTPFLESLAGGDSLYPPSVLLLWLQETHRALGWKLILHVFAGGLFMYGWLRALERSRAASFLGGLAFTLAPFMVTLVYPGHDGKLFVTALTPLLFWVVERAFRGRTLGRWTAVAGVVGLIILTTHFQMAYFLFGAAGIYAFFRTWQVWRGRGPGDDVASAHDAGSDGVGVADDGARGDRGGNEAGGPGDGPPGGPGRRRAGPAPALGRLALFLAAALLGASLAGVQLVPAVEYVTEHSRRTATTVQADEAGSVAYSSSWSLHPEEVMALVVPEFVGNDAGGGSWAQDTYWGRNPFKLNHEYAGLVVLLLAGLSFFGAPRRGLRWALSGLGGVGLLYALGTHTPVWRFFYEVVPGVSLFRAPSMAVFLFGFTAVTLAAFGVDRGVELARDAAEEGWRTAFRFLWISAAALGALTALAASGVLTSAWTAVLYPELGGAKAEALGRARPFIVRGFFLATLLAGATAGLWWARRAGKVGTTALVGGLTVLLFADAARVDAPFIQTLDFRAWAEPDATTRFLVDRAESESPFRVFSMVQGGQDVKPGMYGLELAAGHHPNDLARYRELIGMEGSGAPRNLLSNMNVMRVLNVRYLVWPEARFGPVEGMERVSESRGRGGRVTRAVYRVPGLPRARLVGRAVVSPEEGAVERIMSPDFDPAGSVVLPAEPPVELPGGPVDGEVEWVTRDLDRLELRVRADEPALLVLAENWYPAWKARVDGEEAPVLRANHTLRAVPVDAGEHTVEMTYESVALQRSLWLSVGTLTLLLGVAGVSFVRRRRRAGG